MARYDFDHNAVCDECGAEGAYNVEGDYLCKECYLATKTGKPCYGPQIGDHPGEKAIRNRQKRRKWKSSRIISPDNRYNGYD